MCDCYTTKCEVCGAAIDVHIGDFSVGREQLRAYCPKHHADALEELVEGLFAEPWIVFPAKVEDAYQCSGAKPGETVLFLVPYPRHIHLN